MLIYIVLLLILVNSSELDVHGYKGKFSTLIDPIAFKLTSVGYLRPFGILLIPKFSITSKLPPLYMDNAMIFRISNDRILCLVNDHMII